jgi:dTDP-glucose 4,6-dehydratase
MNILVAGGAGFIGSNFIRYILEEYPNYKVVNYDKLTYAGNLDNLRDVELNPNYKFIKGDIIDLERLNEVIQRNKITHIVNFAAETHVDRSIHGGAKEFVMTNTLGVQMLLDATRSNNLKLMINVSTDEVYGSLGLDEKKKFREDTPIWPNMPYAAAKAGGDLMCQAYWATHKTPVVVTHCSNNYGPYQYPEKLIPFFIFKAMAGEKLPVYGDGLNVRDWIHVRDHAKALSTLLHKGKPGEVYNIGVDNERNNLEVTKLILKFLNKPEDNFEFVKDRPGHDRRYAIDQRKIMKLGWKPDYSRSKFEKGLKETIQWYQENTQWVEDLWDKARLANPHIKNGNKKGK